jgi:hypothetical protein
MRILLLACLCLLFVFSHAQRQRLPSPFNIDADTTKTTYISFFGDTSTPTTCGMQYDKSLDSQYRLGLDYTFEFRLRQYHLENNFDNVFVLTLKQGKWSARYFDRNNGIHGRIVFTERVVDQSPVNQLWQLLVQNEVLTLPSQVALSERLVSYIVDTSSLHYPNMKYLYVTDGVAYEFSLQTPTQQRHYSYRCPQAYLSQFGNVKELFQAVMLITLIKKFLGHPLRVC